MKKDVGCLANNGKHNRIQGSSTDVNKRFQGEQASGGEEDDSVYASKEHQRNSGHSLLNGLRIILLASYHRRAATRGTGHLGKDEYVDYDN